MFDWYDYAEICNLWCTLLGYFLVIKWILLTKQMKRLKKDVYKTNIDCLISLISRNNLYSKSKLGKSGARCETTRSYNILSVRLQNNHHKINRNLELMSNQCSPTFAAVNKKMPETPFLLNFLEIFCSWRIGDI